MDLSVKNRLPVEYRMPAEWSRHSATQLHWPENRETWPGEKLQKVEEVYLNIIEVLHRFEPIVLLASPGSLKRIEQLLLERCSTLQSIHLYDYPVNDVWARDCGPVFVENISLTDTEYTLLDWDYNAWGEKYHPFDSDNRIPQWMAEIFQLPVVSPGLVLEGGSIEVNGKGDLLTTESVLLNPNRNPNRSKEEIAAVLRQFLGVDNIIWLKSGLAGDDTDGHIDDLARFLGEDTILATLSKDPENVNYRTLQENLEILRSATDKNGAPYNIEILPIPEYRIEGTTVDGSEYVPASYANFYLANGLVLVPMYDPRYDQEALELFSRYFSEREVVGIPCGDLVWGQGSIHCITQQLYGLNI